MERERMDVTGRRVTVMGLGRFGGGVGVTRWLASQGADVLVTDKESEARLGESIAKIGDLVRSGAVTLRLGGHNVSDFTTCDLVVANPAVPKPWEDRFIRSATAAGVPVTTEIGLTVERLNRGRAIGVTGSAGKSTTAAMIHHVLNAAGHRAHLGGNIGGSLLGALDAIDQADWVVLELSSAMLHWLGGAGDTGDEARGWSPYVAVITNISPNHIDWHGSFEHYRASKMNIAAYQQPGDHLLNMDAQEALAAGPTGIRLRLPGAHNATNARVALAAVEAAVELKREAGAELLRDFGGLPHRLQCVQVRDGCRYFNDSKSTTPEATVLAVEAFEQAGRVHLIAGGYDKGSDLTAIAELARRVAGLYTIGATGAGLAERARQVGGHVQECTTLARAVEAAMERMNEGDVLLLSPGCASWDQFTNFEERGEAFVRLVRERVDETVKG